MGVRVHLDFETRSILSVSDVGACVYAAHPSTTPLCLSFAVDDGGVILVTRSEILSHALGDTVPDLRYLYELAEDPEAIFVAHNAFFEQNIWRECMVRRFGAPEIPIRRWRCTAAKAAALALPRSLEGVGKALGLPIQKDMNGNRVMMKLSRPRIASKSNPRKFWEPEDVPNDFHILYEYNKNDVKTEQLVDKALPDLSPAEQEVWFLDQEVNFRGVQIDVAVINRTLEFAEIHTNELRQEFRALTGGEVSSPSQVEKYLDWLDSQGVSLPNLQAPTVDAALELHQYGREILPDAAARTLEIRRQLSKTSIKKYPKMLKQADPTGRVRDTLLYHAASTGRWGGKGAQLQNLPRPKTDTIKAIKYLMASDYETFSILYSNMMNVFSWNLRGTIIAREGYDLIAADFSQIEARVLAWLAGETEALNVFASGEDAYIREASGIYGFEINAEDHPEERQVGKVSILALGFGGGISAFASMAKQYGVDLVPVYSTLWPRANADERDAALRACETYLRNAAEPLPREGALAADLIKQRWRANNPNIQKFWRELEQASLLSVALHNEGKASLVQCGKVHFACQGKGNLEFLFCRLPSGRKLAYHMPKIRDEYTPWGEKKPTLSYMGVDSQTKQYYRVKMYGGKWAENITQAVARDLQAYSWLNLEKASYPPVLGIHDESISEVPEGFGSVEEYERIMAHPPSWADGLPIKAKGWRGKRYHK